MKEDKSDSSYDVEEENQATCPVGGCCKCNCKCPCECILNALSPENLPATVEKHQDIIERIQEIIMFKRPIAFAATIIFVNFIFFLHCALNLNFYAQCILAAIIGITFKLFGGMIKQIVVKALFNGEVSKGEGSNRVRSTEEVTEFLKKVTEPIFAIKKIVSKFAADETVNGLLIYAVILFGLFVLTAAVDLFGLVVILVNAFLIIPGIYLHPSVQQFIKKGSENGGIKETIGGIKEAKEVKEEVEKKAEEVVEEKPEELVEEAKEVVEEKPEELVEEAKEAVEEKAEEVAEEKAEEVKEAVEEKAEEIPEEIKEAAEQKEQEVVEELA